MAERNEWGPEEEQLSLVSHRCPSLSCELKKKKSLFVTLLSGSNPLFLLLFLHRCFKPSSWRSLLQSTTAHFSDWSACSAEGPWEARVDVTRELLSFCCDEDMKCPTTVWGVEARGYFWERHKMVIDNGTCQIYCLHKKGWFKIQLCW